MASQHPAAPRQHAPHAHHHDGPRPDDTHLAELLDLDAEVLHEQLDGLTAWAAELTDGTPPRRILDLGSGTGTGTFALLKRFESAEAEAVDASPQLLQHLADRARALGLADRVHPVRADLDTTWPAAVGTVDLVWASASLHHLADPDRTLREAFAALRPGGLLLAIEMDSVPFPRFLPHELGLGRPGLEERCHAALTHRHGGDLPDLGSDWGPRLAGAGFTVEAERELAVDLRAPLPAAAGRYAQAALQRMRGGLDGSLSAEDLTTLDLLISDDGPESVRHRTDLVVRTRRLAWAARRPSS
ncbi:class I SAM-dependent methyltransferase [Streptacidiphilus sp. P02-A3a]|uniref:class I SAM-dependent methyltransferase n=1 Tax=Streptacidiphilus sp. P02-A3a TaxID=2704468 RepID=UPI0015F89793|nr:class I SAM-dependent methyltransferase [Streptacidiphilus sp. P02-A3a]QMU69717.1 class I SAM-dependent methyltransferase [Streptacidiphilus sp. P02-A3a]